MPDAPELLADLIQTMDFPSEARTCEERCQAVHDARSKAIWNFLAPAERTAGPLPWAAYPPAIYDPGHLLTGEHDVDWAVAHPLMDFYPAPAGGLQHRVTFVAGRFTAHGVPASLLPVAPTPS